jgi:hypothetical protein
MSEQCCLPRTIQFYILQREVAGLTANLEPGPNDDRSTTASGAHVLPGRVEVLIDLDGNHFVPGHKWLMSPDTLEITFAVLSVVPFTAA